MTSATPAVYEEDFRAEQSVKLYLDWAGEDWAISSVTMDGYPLDAEDEVYSDLHKEHWTAENHATAEKAERHGLPNAEEVTVMLLAALDPDSDLGAALAKVIDAAGKWSDELTEYVAKGLEQHEDPESAENSRDEAAAIGEAIKLLTSR